MYNIAKNTSMFCLCYPQRYDNAVVKNIDT